MKEETKKINWEKQDEFLYSPSTGGLADLLGQESRRHLSAYYSHWIVIYLFTQFQDPLQGYMLYG